MTYRRIPETKRYVVRVMVVVDKAFEVLAYNKDDAIANVWDKVDPSRAAGEGWSTMSSRAVVIKE